ncbi:MAG: hypothetical protein ACP5UA_07010 [Candidatus Hydrogenedens sp.]
MLLNLVNLLLILSGNMSEEQTYKEIARNFINDTIHYEVKDITIEKTPLRSNFLLYDEPVITLKADNAYLLSIGEKSKIVLSCIGLSIEGIEGEKIDTVNDAFKQLYEVFKYYNLPLQIEECSVKESIDKYIFQKELLYNNIICRNSGIRVEILKKNGTTMSILYKPCIEPLNKFPPKINEKELEEVLNNWLKEQTYFQKYPAKILGEEKLRIVIAPKLNQYDPNSYKNVLIQRSAIERYYAYEMSIVWEEKGKKWFGWVWIDGNSKKVIGGFPNYSQEKE